MLFNKPFFERFLWWSVEQRQTVFAIPVEDRCVSNITDHPIRDLNLHVLALEIINCKGWDFVQGN